MHLATAFHLLIDISNLDLIRMFYAALAQTLVSILLKLQVAAHFTRRAEWEEGGQELEPHTMGQERTRSLHFPPGAAQQEQEKEMDELLEVERAEH